MGFYDRAPTAQEQDTMQNTIGSTPAGQTEMAIAVVLFLVIMGVAVYLIMQFVKKYKLAGTADRDKKFYAKVKNMPIWRLTNVIYWALVCISVLMAFISTDGFGNSPYVGYGLLVSILSYPGYLVLKRTVAYVFNAGDTKK